MAQTAQLPKTILSGVAAESDKLKTVLISAIAEVSGHVRFGDGTDIDTTITETDMVLNPDGDSVYKFIWAGSKRRGVDRRTIHQMRNRYWQDTDCYIPTLCGQCPTCWLYGFTGTTSKDKNSAIKDINAKSRIHYPTSVSVETVEQGQNRHNRNMVDEKKQTTAGEAGIHKEQVIVAGVHFPIYTSAMQVLDWELGAFAHALLENLNANRYTAASRAQGGVRWAVDEDNVPIIVIDESSDGIFPLSVPKIPGWETDYQNAIDPFLKSTSREFIKSSFELMGFEIGESDDNVTVKHDAEHLFNISFNANGKIIIKQNDEIKITRYQGNAAFGYLRRHQLTWQSYLNTLQDGKFWKDVKPYVEAIK